MLRLQAALAATLAFLNCWFWFIIAVSALVAGSAFLRACSVGNRVEDAFHGQPAVPAKVVKALEKKNARLEKKVEKATAQRDSAFHAAVIHEAQADQLKTQTDTLTARYNDLPTSLAHAALPQLQRDLATYRPAPFPDTTAR